MDIFRIFVFYISVNNWIERYFFKFLFWLVSSYCNVENSLAETVLEVDMMLHMLVFFGGLFENIVKDLFIVDVS